MRQSLRFLSIWILHLLLLSPLTSFAREAQHSTAIESARKEGKLVWYTSMAVDTSKPLLDGFLKDYPFIKAELVRLGEEQLMTRILNETRAGKWAFDVMSGSAISTLVDRQIIAPYPTPERNSYRDEFKDPQAHWTGVFVNNLILAYNTRQVSAKDLPRDYADLLDPKWKGKMLMDATDYDWFGTLASVWGREKTLHYMTQLARQEPQWRRGHGLTAQLVAAGEVPLAWAYSFRIERMKGDGAPVDWIDTFNPIITTLSGIGLSAKPTHVNTGKLFIDFVTSTKAQEMIRDMRRIPARTEVKPLAPKMDQNRLKLKAVPKEVYLGLDDYAREFRKIFGL
jgi:iron(III) transport system substrate-binding protein